MNSNAQTTPLDTLQKLLERQIELAQKGNYTAVEKLVEQTNELIAAALNNINANTIAKVIHISNLYKKLDLMLNAEKTLVKSQQKTVDNVRKTLSLYSSNRLS